MPVSPKKHSVCLDHSTHWTSQSDTTYVAVDVYQQCLPYQSTRNLLLHWCWCPSTLYIQSWCDASTRAGDQYKWQAPIYQFYYRCCLSLSWLWLRSWPTSPVHSLEEVGEMCDRKPAHRNRTLIKRYLKSKITGKPSEESDPSWVGTRCQSLRVQSPNRMITLLAVPGRQSTSKIFVKQTSDDWFCWKLERLYLTLKILLRYNSLPCGTECFTGCREAQTTNAREKQACSWFGLIGCRDVITSCVSASFSLVAAILDALLNFQSCFLLYLWIYCLSFVHNSAFPLFSSIESYTQFSALPVLYFVSFLTSS